MWIFIVIVGLAAGIFDDGWPPAAALLLLALLAIWLLKSYRTTKTYRTAMGLMILAYLYANVYQAVLFDGLFPHVLSGQGLQVQGDIVRVVQQDTQRHQFLYRVRQCLPVAAGEQPCQFQGQVMLSLYPDRVDDIQLPSVGEQWQFQVRLYALRGFMNPGQSRYRLRQLAKGVQGRGYVVRPDTALRLSPAPFWQQILQRWREAAASRIAAVSNDGELPLVSTLLSGNHSALDTEHWQLLKHSGTLHLVVVSGLHIGVLLAIGWLISVNLSRFLPLDRFRHRVGLRCLPLLLLLPMLVLWPSGVAVWRALLMALLLIVMRAAGILLTPWRILWLAVLLLLISQPLYLLRPGFYYSVWAVALLLLVVVPGRQSGLFLRIQLVLLLGLLPVQSFWQNTPELISGLSNLLAIPLVSLVILPLSLLTLLLPLPVLIHWLDQAEQLFWQWLRLSLEFSWGVWPLEGGVGLGLILIALLLAIPMVPGRRLAFVVLLVWGWQTFYGTEVTDNTDSHPFQVQVFDVGQGLSALIQVGERWLVYDTGPRFSSGFMPVALVLPPLLQAKKASVDLLVVSHDDRDHAGGISALMPWTDRILAGQPERLSVSLPVAACHAGMTQQWGRVMLEVLYPPSGAHLITDNQHSCVVRVRSLDDPRKSILFTGDIGQEAERWLLASGQDLRTEWLVASHHGSADGNSLAFLAAVQPAGILYAAGFNNAYRHPSAAVLQRVQYLRQRYGEDGRYREYNTAVLGALSLLPDGDAGWQLQAQREQVPLRWLWQR